MWTRSGNGETVIPPQVEYSGNHVIVRKNFHLIEEGETPAHYEWDEWQMTKDQYEVYLDFEDKLNEQDDALIELAGMISEVV